MANLLIVDDLDGKRLWMRSLLEADGQTVVEAVNGLEALARAAEHSFDVIITDINMPEMDGVELIHRLRLKAADNIKILAVSAGTDDLSSDVSLQAGHAVGADAILYMPCRPAEFLEAVRILLDS